MSNCIDPIDIPKLDCYPVFSIDRVQVYLPVNIDTTEVVNSFEFNEADVNTSWEYTVKILDATAASDNPPNGDCDVGDNLVTQKEKLKYISYLDSAIAAAGGRDWISPVSCEDFTDGDSPSAGKRGAVHFANPRTRNMSLPTFIPRSGGGGKQESANCPLRLGRYLGVNEEGKHMVELLEISCNGLVPVGVTTEVDYI